MLLSEELLAIGRKSNPKNNLSQFESFSQIVDICNGREKALPRKQINNTLALVFTTLAREGYPYFTTLWNRIQEETNTSKNEN